MKTLIILFTTFAKIGLFTFGGGYAMLPIIAREVADKRNWTTHEELLNFYAVAQCTPGIISVNTATFIGAKQKGVMGAIFSTLGIILPSVVIITLIAVFLNNFGDNQTLQNAFAGIRIAACAMIAVSVLKLAKQAISGIVTATAAVTAFALVAFLGISPVIIAPAAGIVGVVYALLTLKRNKRGASDDK